MAEWNPNTTATKGMEWFPHTKGSVTLDSNLKSAAMSLLQTVGAAIGSAQIYVGAIPVRGGLYVVEAYDNEDAASVFDANTLQRAVPNEDVSGTGATSWQEDDGTTTSIFSEIDESILVGIDYADYITVPRPMSPAVAYRHRYATAGLTLTGRRVLQINSAAYVWCGDGATYRTGLNISGVDYWGPTLQNINQIVNTPHFFNPGTKLPWRIADAQAFDATDEIAFEGLTPNGSSFINVYWSELSVQSCPETRLAFGVLNDTASALTPNAWNTVTLTTPTGGTWTKDGSGRHLYVIRRINDTGALTIPYLDSGTAPNPARSFDTAVDAYQQVVLENGPQLSRVYPIIIRTTAPADSVDSQPYADLVEVIVKNAQTAQQEFSNAATTDYGFMRCLVKPNAASADLLVKIRKRSDSSQVGGTLTITKAVVDALPDAGGGWKLFTGQLASAAALAAATQYYIEYSSTATGTGTDYWSVQSVDTASTTAGVTAGFGGTTDRGTINGAAEADRSDVTGTVAVLPTTPTNWTGALGSQNIDDTVCGYAAIDRADLSWTATALGGSFLRYEIQRTEDAGTTWEAIVNITTESIATFKDYEGRRGIAVGYRIRVIRTDLSASDWSATQTVTKPVTCPALVLVSNYDPTFNVAYDYAPDIPAKFLEADEAVLVSIYGRDKSLGFQPIEERGATEQYTMYVAMDDRTAIGSGVGLAAFGPLRAIARAELPYVCVLDVWKNRLYAQLRVSDGEHRNPLEQHVASAAATEISDAAYVVTVA